MIINNYTYLEYCGKNVSVEACRCSCKPSFILIKVSYFPFSAVRPFLTTAIFQSKISVADSEVDVVVH